MSLTIFDALAEVGAPTARRDAPFQIACPIHKAGGELRPSARVYPDTDSMYCWTCGRAWNPVSLVAEARGYSYTQSRAYLAERYGIYVRSAAGERSIQRVLTELIDALAASDYRGDDSASLLDPILLSASRGDPPWEVEDQITALTRRIFPHLSISLHDAARPLGV